MPGTDRTTLWVTANPYGDVFDHLRLPGPLSVRLHRADHLDGATAALLARPARQRRPRPARRPHRRADGAGRDRAHPLDADARGRLRLLARRRRAASPGGPPTPRTSCSTPATCATRCPAERLDDALTGWSDRSPTATRPARATATATRATPSRTCTTSWRAPGGAHKARILTLLEQAPKNPRYEEREQLYLLAGGALARRRPSLRARAAQPRRARRSPTTATTAGRSTPTAACAA